MWLRAVFGEITRRLAISLARQAPRQEAQNVHLAGCQPRRPLATSRHPVPGGTEYGLHRVTVEPPRLDLGAQLGRGLLRRQSIPVRTGLAHRLIRVDRTQDPRRYRDRPARQAPGVARTVETLSVLRPRSPQAEPAQRTGAASARSDTGASAPVSHSPAPERSALVPDGVGDPEPADTVDQPGAAERPHLVSRHAELRTRRQPARSETARAWPSV